MTSDQIRSKFLEFFKARKHAIIPSASLVPSEEVGATTSSQTLFTTAGMQPLIPYLLGKPHQAGTRLADVQKCVRTGDIDDVGDNRHLTFFEMLGNWSLGDYFKKEAIEWSFEFLTSKKEGLGLDPQRLYVTVFKGENGIPRDEESIKIWQEVFKKNSLSNGVAGDDEKMNADTRIIPLGVKDNFWIAGDTGPCGGDTEMFYDTRPEEGELTGKFGDIVDSFRLIEVWNDVFMEFNKTADGKYEKLAKKNVDTGMGLERTTAVVNGKATVFETDCFEPLIAKLNGDLNKELIKKESWEERQRSNRIVADHIRTATFMLADGVTPSNTDRGYVLRRILRRAILHADQMGCEKEIHQELVEIVIKKYAAPYPELEHQREFIVSEFIKEEMRFRKTLHDGKQELLKILGRTQTVTAEDAFRLYQSFGFPLELTKEFAKQQESASFKVAIDEKSFFEEFKKHQELSRAGAEKKFKGGLGDMSEKSLQYHTATHLLNAALNQVLGPHVGQKGSNITPERLRFDFSHGEKMTDEQKKKTEALVNGWIAAALPVGFKEMPKAEAEKIATHAFNEKYGDIVKVYFVGDEKSGYFSREFCGGPHVKNTMELCSSPREYSRGQGPFKILKEEAVAAGIRRIKAVLL